MTDSISIEEFYSVVHKIYELGDMKEVEEAGKGFDNILLLHRGIAIELPFEKLTNQEIQDWISNLETSSFSCEADQQIFQIIMGEMPNAVQGKTSEKDAAEEACQKINLYLDE